MSTTTRNFKSFKFCSLKKVKAFLSEVTKAQGLQEDNIWRFEELHYQHICSEAESHIQQLHSDWCPTQNATWDDYYAFASKHGLYLFYFLFNFLSIIILVYYSSFHTILASIHARGWKLELLASYNQRHAATWKIPK